MICEVNKSLLEENILQLEKNKINTIFFEYNQVCFIYKEMNISSCISGCAIIKKIIKIAHPENICFDLVEVNSINSIFIGKMIDIQSQCKSKIKLKNVCFEILNILKLTGTDKNFEIIG